MLQDKIITQLVELASKDGAVEVMWLYGSRANGTANYNSDYDLAIAFCNFDLSSTEKFLRPNELALDWATKLELAENKISIVDINLVPIYLAFHIVEYGGVIYQGATLRAYTEQDSIYSQYEYQMIENKHNEYNISELVYEK